MGDNITDLYLKYTEALEPALYDDRYFQYMFESIRQSGSELSHSKQLLHKVVDQEWIEVIENNIQAIFDVIEKPRRFVTTKEEVVPVALAKKISADSIRHLSQNTQFISDVDGDEIQPSKVLNVEIEETYNLYENRFIYCLIDKLANFIDKRTEAIFWITGDEVNNIFTLQSHIDDAYETIDYKVEMKIKNNQSASDNDNDNMDVFMRIDRVKRLVTMLKKSSFCELLAGTEKVKSPIQRTNMIMKDKNFRKCFELWNFIERYDSIGYIIESHGEALEYDEEYQTQLFTLFVQNYSLFKSILDPDMRSPEMVLDSKDETKTPKFIKEIREELVTDRDLPDVEIRRVFVEEVTQAQVEAEEALAREKEETKRLTEELQMIQREAEDARIQAENAMFEMNDALQRADDAYQAQLKAEELKAKAEYDAAIAIQDRQTAEAKQADAEQNIAVLKKDFADKEQKFKATEDELKELRTKEAAAVHAVAQVQEKIDAMAAERDEAVSSIEGYKKTAEECTAQLEETKKNAADSIADAKAKAEAEIEKIKEESRVYIENLNKSNADAIAASQREKDQAIKNITDARDAAISAEKQRADEAIAAAQASVDEAIQSEKDRADQAIMAAQSEKNEAIAQVVAEKNAAVNAVQLEKYNLIEASLSEIAELKAAAKANTFSEYIARSIKMRKPDTKFEELAEKEINKKNSDAEDTE